MVNTADPYWIHREAQRTLTRLLPRIHPYMLDTDDYARFVSRLQQHFPKAFGHLYAIYGDQYDFFYHLENTLNMMMEMFAARPVALRELDTKREADPLWYKRETMVGGVCYVDLFADDLKGVRAKIPYFKEMGLTYVHLMPLFRAPAENSDGGYAISNFREVDPKLGTMEELTALADELRENGISLTLDFVFNHTSDEHEWALRALAGEEQFQDYYYMFPDRTLPDQYERNLREIFPEQHPGNFSYRGEIDKWIWTTFNNFQWDLNYSNPEVFGAMLGEMLFLVNQGVEILRLDAVAFIWKRMGTSSENLPEVHHIIRAFNAMLQIVAPAVVFKSEAIVHPDDVASFIDRDECHISYNPTFMALIWEALATKDTTLLRHSMSKRYDIPADTAWVNYVRVHDDIGWSFADEDAVEVGINGFDHRQFLNQFYTGNFPMSFARGVPFNYNPITKDMRICGTAASLAGLEEGMELQHSRLIELAKRRIIMIHSLILAAGGIPLIYIGDEIATLNDYSYTKTPTKAQDSRWVHRVRFDWVRADDRHKPETVIGGVFLALQRLAEVRKQTAAFCDATMQEGGQTLFFDTQNTHVLGMLRNRAVIVLANFSPETQVVRRDVLSAYYTVDKQMLELYSGEMQFIQDGIELDAYEFVWLTRPL